MSNELTLTTLLPRLTDTRDISNKTFVGIDFGTSTSVASFSMVGEPKNPIVVDTIPCSQQLGDGRTHESHLVPTAIAWHKNQLLIGAGARA